MSIVSDVFNHFFFDPIPEDATPDEIIAGLAKQSMEYPMVRQGETFADVFIEDLPSMVNTKPLIIERVLTKYSSNSLPYTGRTIETNLVDKIFGKKEEPTLTHTRNPGLALGALSALYVGYAK